LDVGAIYTPLLGHLRGATAEENVWRVKDHPFVL